MAPPETQNTAYRQVEMLSKMNIKSSNMVVTSHYTIANFVPKNLMEQYSKPANVYFLFICILQAVPPVSQTNGYPTTAVAVVFICLLNMVKDATEDWRRHKSDTVENEALAKVMQDKEGRVEKKKWCDIKLGDILLLQADEAVPADIVIMSTAHEEGHVYIETRNLDGETNLKTKQAPEAIFKLFEQPGEQLGNADVVTQRLVTMSASIDCEGPNEFLYTFEGTARLEHQETRKEVSLSEANIILRGCKVKNVAWVLGMVVYTGHETKMMKNTQDKKYRKVSHLDYSLGKLTLAVFVLQTILCLIAAIVGALNDTSDTNLQRTYLDLGNENHEAKESFGKIFAIRFFNFVLLFTNFIPISLLVSVNCCKAIQVVFLVYDEEMVHHEVGCMPRSCDLNDELGQVQHVFSDKTGTLTCNVMDFRQFCVRGVKYGEGCTEIKRSVMQKMGMEVPDNPTLPEGHKQTPHVDLIDVELQKLLDERRGPQYEAVKSFFLHLAINHEAFVNEDKSGQLQYSASSPDEAALCYGAHHFGYSYRSRDQHTVTVGFPDGSATVVTIQAILKFNSTRKRSSVIVQFQDEVDGKKGDMRRMLFCKGADNVIMARLTREEQGAPATARTQDIVKVMAEDGLRTLCLAGKELREAEVKEWLGALERASCATQDRQQQIDACYEAMETDLTLHGVTGIEDRLQDGVADAIVNMGKAGIKVWMLTGDMFETAVNIGIATGLLRAKPDKQLQRPCFRKEKFEDESGVFNSKEMADELRQLARTAENPQQGFEALVIDGKCLEVALLDENASNLCTVCRACATVVCCRVSPKQKGMVVCMVKKQERVVTLAIGDGANDCNMIQSADVGIGIRGLEGLQAFNVCDYGISQFRFIQTLLLVHGRWNYRRIAILVNYTFYKNFVVVLPQFFFGFVSGFSGQKLYNDIHYQFYNVFLSVAPICFFALVDQDVSRKASVMYPQLYKMGIRSEYLNFRISSTWMICGVWHALVIFIVPYCTMSNGNVTNADGKANDIWLVGTVMMLCVCLVVNLVVVLETCLMNWVTALGLFMTFIAWLLMQVVEMESAFVGSTARLFGSPMLWLVALTTTALSLTLDVQMKAVRCNFFPTELHNVQGYILADERGELPKHAASADK